MNRVRRFVIALATTAVAASGVIVLAGPASAAGCYNRSGYSFQAKYETTYDIIHAYRGSGCGGNQIGYGIVSIIGIGRDSMYVEDTACDNVGIYGYTHGYSAHPAHCDLSDRKNFNLSDVSGAKNWWLNVGGSVNSNAEGLPA